MWKLLIFISLRLLDLLFDYVPYPFFRVHVPFSLGLININFLSSVPLGALQFLFDFFVGLPSDFFIYDFFCFFFCIRDPLRWFFSMDFFYKNNYYGPFNCWFSLRQIFYYQVVNVSLIRNIFLLKPGLASDSTNQNVDRKFK